MLRRQKKLSSSIEEAISARMAISTCGDVTAVRRVKNSLLVATADALYVVTSRQKAGILGFMEKCITPDAIVQIISSGDVVSWYARVTGIARKTFRR